jgi:hypothetical protein
MGYLFIVYASELVVVETHAKLDISAYRSYLEDDCGHNPRSIFPCSAVEDTALVWPVLDMTKDSAESISPMVQYL